MSHQEYAVDIVVDDFDESCGIAAIPTKANVDSTTLSSLQRSHLPRRYSDAASTISESTVSSFETEPSEDVMEASEDFEAFPVERRSMVFIGVQGQVPARKRRGGKKLFFPGRC